MAKSKDLTGLQFAKLTVLYRCEENYKTYDNYGCVCVSLPRWHCMCECGREIDVIGKNLTHGHTKSCGCMKKITSAHNLKQANRTRTNKLDGN